MKQLISILFFLLLTHAVLAQHPAPFQPVKSYPVSVVDAAMDNLGNLYLLTAADYLKKYSASGDSVAAYNNVRKYGKLHSMDVSNPLKLLLFYKDYGYVVILDRLLAVRAAIDFRSRNIVQVSAIGLSYDNNIWLFDALENKLKKMDEAGNVVMESSDFRQLFREGINPVQIIDQDNLVYLYDPASGVYVFDHFGTFKRKIPIRGWESLSIKDKYVLGISNKKLVSYNTSTLLESSVNFPGDFEPYYRYYLNGNHIIALAKDSLTIYSYK